MNQSPTNPRVSRTGQLRDLIKEEGGRWDGKRALAAYRQIGFDCTIQRARVNLEMVAEQNPDLLKPVDGKRWTYDTVEAAA